MGGYALLNKGNRKEQVKWQHRNYVCNLNIDNKQAYILLASEKGGEKNGC